jgi:hypothetical protein
VVVLTPSLEIGMPKDTSFEDQRGRLVEWYLVAKQSVVDRGFGAEIEWQDSLVVDELNEQTFLRESAWVVLSSGMRESVVRKKFPEISAAFFEWRSAKDIVERSRSCQRKALRCFGHEAKIKAISKIAESVFSQGFDAVRTSILIHGTEYLAEFPYIGPATKYHLAKNIGLQAVKPDRHLLRIADKAGYNSPYSLCADISNVVGDKLSVVDLVIWRYAVLNEDYLLAFSLD